MSEIQLIAGATPSTPATDVVTLYPKAADNRLYYKDENGLEHEVSPTRYAELTITPLSATGTDKARLYIPAGLNSMNMVSINASLNTQGRAGGPLMIQVTRRRSGAVVNMLTTPVQIDANEDDSSTAAAAAVINTTYDDVTTGDLLVAHVVGMFTSQGQGAAILTLGLQRP